MSIWGQLGFPDPKTENAKNLILYHDITLVVVALILVLVVWFLVVFLLGSKFFGGMMNRYVHKNDLLEIIWTVSPAFILFVLGYVSLVNLYQMELGDETEHLVKVTGHQWYWDYEYLVSFGNVGDYNYVGWFCDMMKGNHDGKLSDFFLLAEASSFSALVFSLDYSVSALGSGHSVGQLFSFLNSSLKGEEIFWEADVNEETDSYLMRFLLSVAAGAGVEDELSHIKYPGSDAGVEERLGYECRFFQLWCKLESYLSSDIIPIGDPFGEVFNFYVLSKCFGDDLSNWFYNDLLVLTLEGDWNLNYDSFLVPHGADKVNFSSYESGFRNADVTNPCFLARSSNNEVLVCTTDVMHSWGITELGVKVDAIPGRTNSLGIIPYSSGVAYGSCYELCGVGHSAMPIKIVISSLKDTNWLLKSMVLDTEEVMEIFGSLVKVNWY
uniref:Cytochrome c oxidase subunit 2 n=1 Tax=Villorita cyprinoides TaxID=1176411 RepID=A0A7L7YVS9_9BIVA|nr:cytochrome c oxidase subunit II [Villorita cyprinoides]QOD40725.1 cytochrome c oxidase subunit 2 [Villorita cyprinoides]